MELLVHALRNGYRHVKEDKKMLFRTYKDGTLRAVLSDEYAIIDNRWYMETLKELLPGGRVSHWRGDADVIWGNILIPDTIREEDDSDYGGMVSIGNSEIGTRALQQYPSVFRAICMNGCIWGRSKGTKSRKVHRGNVNLMMLRQEICKNINTQIPLLQDGVDKFMATKALEVKDTSLANLFAYIADQNSIGGKVINEVAQQFLAYEKDSKNAFGVINALTRAGQKFDNETWYDLDCLAGEMMYMTEHNWATMLSGARNMSEDKVTKVFSVAV
jgi:hypothetical protein